MQFKLPPGLLLVLGILLAWTLVEGASIPERQVSSGPWIGRRGLWSSLGFDLEPRRLGGGLFSKPKPAPAPAPAPKPAPAPAPAPAPKPAPAPAPAPKPSPAPAPAPAPKPAPASKPAPAPVKASTPASQKPAPAPVSSLAPPPVSKSAVQLASSNSAAPVSSLKATTPSAQSTTPLSTPATSTVSVPRKCNVQSCGADACPAPTGTQTDATDASTGNGTLAIAKRAFFPMEGNGATEKLTNKKGNKDASPFARRTTGFIPFDGTNRKSVTVVGLEGCTVVCAFSSKGMVVEHLFEGSQPDASGRVDITNTLHPSALDDTIKVVQARLAANRAQLAGGQAILMLPMNPAKGKNKLFKYDSEEVLAFDAATGKLDPTEAINSEGVVDDIRQMVTDALGLTAQEVQYIPPLTDAQAKANAAIKSPKGTFAIQYDPNNGPDGAAQNAVQVFAENNAVLATPFNFDTAA